MFLLRGLTTGKFKVWTSGIKERKNPVLLKDDFKGQKGFKKLIFSRIMVAPLSEIISHELAKKEKETQSALHQMINA